MFLNYNLHGQLLFATSIQEMKIIIYHDRRKFKIEEEFERTGPGLQHDEREHLYRGYKSGFEEVSGKSSSRHGRDPSRIRTRISCRSYVDEEPIITITIYRKEIIVKLQT